MRKLRITSFSAMLLMAGLAAQAQAKKQETGKTSVNKEVAVSSKKI